MIRQNITLGEYIYIVDLYKANVDNIDNIYNQYYMIRRQNLMNNISYDTDIYFIEKDILDSCLDEDGKLNTKKLSDLIVYPIPGSKYSGYSKNEKDFNYNFNEYTFRKYFDELGEEIPTEIYNLYSIDKIVDDKPIYKIADVLTDIIYIYHPSLKSKNNSIIYIDNYVNNIHFHYLCREYNKFNSYCKNVFDINNQSYSEYIEIRIPNLETLFGTFNNELLDIKNIYFKEITNIVDIEYYDEDENGNKIKMIKSLNYNMDNNEEDIINIINNDFEIINENEIDSYIPLNILLKPFFIEKIILKDKLGLKIETDFYKKVYTNIDTSIENNYITFPINVTLFPYEGIDDVGHYLMDKKLSFNTDMFVTPCNITLSAKIGFDTSINANGYENGCVSIIGKFNYPYEEYFMEMFKNHKNQIDLALQKAYAKYNNLKISYNEETDLFEYDDYKGWLATQEDLEEWNNLSEIWEEFDINTNIGKLGNSNKINMVGLNIVLASDYNITNIIYKQDFNIDEVIGNFAFNLNGIFNSWEQLPEVLVAQITFIDRWLGNKIISNKVIINKEWFKYLINDSNIYKLVINTEKNNLKDNMNTSYINYIDNINCIINKNTNSENQININKNQVKVLYKPIFYKTTDTQNLRLREGISQNIGINLGDYMTKVEIFKIRIGGEYFVESSRNNNYVIFKINASLLNKTSGIYDILDNDEYITGGSWSLY